MRYTFILMGLVLSVLGSALASDGREEIVPKKDFKSFVLNESILKSLGRGYDCGQPDDEQNKPLISNIKKVVKDLIDLKWKVCLGLAEKIGKADLMPNKESLLNTFEIYTMEEGKRERISAYGGAQSYILDQVLDRLLSPLNFDCLKYYLAHIHYQLFLEDVLLYALADAPESTWKGAEYCTLEPQAALTMRKNDFASCYGTLWQNTFIQSFSQQEIRPDMEVIHTILGYDEVRIPHAGMLSYVYQMFRCCARGGKNCGRQKSDDPGLFLMEPRTRLYEYASSMRFKAILDRKHERRIIHYPSIEFINNALPWSILTGATFPDARVCVPEPRTAKAEPLRLVSAKPQGKPQRTKGQLKEQIQQKTLKDNTVLNTRLDEAHHQIAELEKNKLDLEKAVLSNKTKMEAQREQIAALKKQLEELQSAGNHSRESELENNIRALEDRREQKNNALIRLQVENERLKTELDSTKILFEESQRKMAAFEKNKSDLEKEARSNKTKIDEQQEQIAKLEKELKSQKSNNHARPSELEMRNRAADYEEQKKRSVALQARAESLEGELRGANKRLANRERELHAQYREDIQKSAEEIEELNKRIAGYGQLISQLNKEIGQLKSAPKPRRNPKSSKLVAMKRNLENEQAERKKLADELNQKEQLEADLKQKKLELEEQLAVAQAVAAEKEARLAVESSARVLRPDTAIVAMAPHEPTLDNLLNRLTACAMQIQHLNDWCVYLQQGWVDAVAQQSQNASGRMIEVGGALYNLTPEQVEQLLIDGLLQQQAALANEGNPQDIQALGDDGEVE